METGLEWTWSGHLEIWNTFFGQKLVKFKKNQKKTLIKQYFR